MTANKILIQVDPDLKDLVPGYLESVKKDTEAILTAAAQARFDVIEGISHRMKGIGVSYGFPVLSELGKSMETAAKEKNQPALQTLAGQLSEYVGKIELIFD